MRSISAKFLEPMVKDKTFKSSKDVKDFIIENIKKKSPYENTFSTDYTKKLFIVVHQLLSYSTNDNKMEEIKKNILLKIMNDKSVNINDEYKNIILAMDEKVLKIRMDIMTIIKEEINIEGLVLEKDILNENVFYDLLLKEQCFIENFISKQKIGKFSCDKNLFNRIFNDYQSLNLNCLQLLYNHLLKFKSFFNLYNLFSSLFVQLENILTDKYIKNNSYLKNYLNKIYSIMESNVYYINAHFDRLYAQIKAQSEQIKSQSEEIKKLKEEIKTLKAKSEETERIKIKLKELGNEIGKLKKKADFQEKKIQKITQYFICPISFEKIRLPVITKYGHTYDDANIRNWIKRQHNDPLNRQPLEERELVINYALKKIMEEFKQIVK